MLLEIKPNKLHRESQQIQIDRNLLMLIGENGSGKSAILERIFEQHLEVGDNEKQIICFSSGMNESFSSIFNPFIRRSRKHLVQHSNTDIDASFKAFYFSSIWSKFLIFFATALKKDGWVRQYLKEKGYCDVSSDGLKDDITSKLKFTLKIQKWYVQEIQRALEQESTNPEFPSIRKTIFHRIFSDLAEKYIYQDYSFETSAKRRNIYLKANEVFDLFNGRKENDIFTFFSIATRDSQFTSLHHCELYLKNGIKINDLSDGEFQLLTVNAIIDLFDSNETIFVFDEIDSHLHYENVKKLWSNLKDIQGKIITTTHSADSIIANHPDLIKLVERGRIAVETTPHEIFKRLSVLSDSQEYFYKVMAKLPFFALLDSHFDWFVFKELCKIKIGEEEVANYLGKIHIISCSSDYENNAKVFGYNKIKWAKKFFDANNDRYETKAIFLICDKDELYLNQINPNCSVRKPHANKMIQEIGNQNNSRHVFLLSWKRREIENYLLSATMLANHGVLEEIQQRIAPAHYENLTNGCNEGLTELDVKSNLQPLYLKDGLTNAGTHEEGVDYIKLKHVIAEIPANEISEDIVAMFNFIRQKIDNAR